MSLYPLVLPLLMAFALTFANRFWGASVTYYPKGLNSDGLYEVEIRFKQTFDSCDYVNWTECIGIGLECVSLVTQEKGVIYNTDGKNAVNFNWCQTERIVMYQTSNVYLFQTGYRDIGCCWTNLTNSFTHWELYFRIVHGNRSDTLKVNRPPLITSISFVRVPQNCPRSFKLIMFDPDEDEVNCHSGRLPKGFTLNETTINDKDFCTLSYRNATVGVYGVELELYDFNPQNIDLLVTNGSDSFTVSWGQGNPLSSLPVQFVVKVDPAVASCEEGVYLPKFLPPTPETGDQIQAVINQELQIIVRATASAAGVRDIIISGPLNTTVQKSNSSSDEFFLRWTPRSEDLGEYFPICFIAESNQINNTSYQSDMRCIIVEVGPKEVIGLKLKVQSNTQLTEEEIKEAVLKFQEELIRKGVNFTSLRLRQVNQINP